ncbi:MAG TPA: hypothetical protein VM261_31935 [Kofleriaceae bacterium]|nr:hypothetical protein [Kofleriaceae bacterium]
MQARLVIAAMLEVLGAIAAVILGGKIGLILLLVVASVAMIIHGGGRWFLPRDGDRGAAWSALGGAIVGAAALGGAWLLSPALLDATGHAVEWTTEPTVRGSISLAAIVALVTGTLALASELVFRRWLLDRIAGYVMARGEPRAVALVAGILVAAVIEAAVSPGGAGFRGGVAVTSLGLGAIYVTSGGRLAASLSARLMFDVGAIIVQALRMTA